MRNAARILAIIFGLVLLGATVTNAVLIGEARRALAETVLRDTKDARAKQYHLVVVIPATDDSFIQGLIEGIEGQASMADAAVQVFRYGDATSLDAASYFELAIRARVDGLIMYCPQDQELDRLRERATANGVLFVPVGTDPPAHGGEGFIGAASLLQGMKGGNLIGEALGSQARVGIILPDTIEGAPRDAVLYRGLTVALQAWPGAKLVRSVQASHGILSGEEATANLLRSGGGINAIFCSSAQDTEGAAQVIVDMNLVGQIMIIGADETPEIRRYIEKGVISASIIRDSRRIGQEAVRSYLRLRAGGQPEAPVEAGFMVRTINGVSR